MTMPGPVPDIPMTHSNSASSNDSPGASPGFAPAGNAASYLLSGEGDARRESRRILIGFAILLLLGMAGLNVLVYRAARVREERNGWSRLEAAADLRRDELDQLFGMIKREARSVALDPEIASDALALVHGKASASRIANFLTEPQQAQAEFEFENVQLVDPLGEVVQETSPSLPIEHTIVRTLARRAVAEGQPTASDPLGSEFMFAVPVMEADGRPGAVLVMHAIGTQFLTPLLARWPGLGPSSGAYLVRKNGEQAAVLTDFAQAGGYPSGARLPLRSPSAMAAAMAATGSNRE